MTEPTAIDSLARACLRDVEPYLPGKPIAEVQRELGLHRVVKLASNENALGPSPRAAAAARRAVSGTNLYPEGSSPLLRAAVARSLGMEPSGVLIGNGSDELIRLLCEAFLAPGDEAVVSRYGFIRFRQQSLLMGARVVEVPMRDFTHDLGAMLRAVGPRTKLVFVASPNNPTATYNTRGEVAALLEGLPEGALLVLDEAYCHYAASRADYPDSVAEFLPGRDNLVVLRTFSKAYGLAGLRVGYAAASPRLVRWLDRIRMPFNVNLPAQAAAEAALADAAHVRRSISLVERERPALARALAGLGLTPGPSAANFLFVRSRLPGRELFERLLSRGVIIRSLDEYGLTHHVRITVGTPAQNRTLVSAARAVLSAGSPAGRP